MTKTYSESEFAKFLPVLKKNGDYWGIRDIRDMGLSNIWTVTEGDDGGLYANPGVNSINALGYLLTAVPHDFEDCVAIWYEAELGECDHCDTEYDPSSITDHCADCGTCWDHCANPTAHMP